MSEILQIDALSKVYAGNGKVTHALGPMDLTIRRGEFVCLLGESGCGKSTLLRIIAGLETATSGRVLFDGSEIRGPAADRGVVFQQPALLPWLTVEQNLELGFRIGRRTINRSVIDESLELVGLEDSRKSFPRSLSGGMAQRAAIARALVNAPKLLLMDEPFSALDAVTRLRMQEEVQRIWRRRGATIFFITHDVDEAVALGTQVIVMSSRPGSMARVFQIPRDQISRELRKWVQSPEFFRLRTMITEELYLVMQGASTEALQEDDWNEQNEEFHCGEEIEN